ncbi:ectoine hydroxylase [Paenibacillus arenilitoris]|uniref:Ectoine hydroxylase n=1 Tax=Paenibacillus arenilitoris TaxID=2772299 RepID=A0A927CLI2_9BACL|nr:ectoine hydroxylase [Paenibacillus arenilitoris]MBD2869739.1 ectoine hydroxylase [Paenibacillus arenilitoris]
MQFANTKQTASPSAADRYPSRVEEQPAFLERQDPVVYSEWTADSPLTKEQSAFYEKNGYLVLDRFFSKEEIGEWRTELRRLREIYQSKEAEHVIAEPESREVRSIFAVHDNNEMFKRLAAHPRLVAIAEYLLGSGTYIHQSRINFKPGFSGKEFYWHSDFETWHVEDGMPAMRAFSCSIALEDNFHHNGPLMVIPGSHTAFVSCIGKTPDNHFKQSLRRQEYGVPDPDSLEKLSREGGIHTTIGEAGSIVLFDCNIMHGSNSNITPDPRSNVFLVYNSVENRLREPYSGQKPRPPYIATRS